MTVTNSAVGRVFRLIADLLEVRGGDDAAKALTYRRAARSIEGYPEEVTVLDAEDRLRDIPGVGEALSRKIAELIETGRVAYLERLMAGIPPGLLDLLEIQGVGAKTAGLLWRELGIGSVDALEEAVRSGALRRIQGFGPKKEQALLPAIASRRRQSGRYPLGLARPAGEALVASLLALPGVARADLAGSARRFRETVANLDLIAAAEDPQAVAEAFSDFPDLREATGPSLAPTEAWTGSVVQVDAVLHCGIPVRLRLVPTERYWGALTYFTGSPAHGDGLARRAAERSLSLGPAGLTAAGGNPHLLGDEEAVYGALGLDFVAPELREGLGEIEAAARHELPRLIGQGDIRGDLHTHSDWSDGMASLRQMAEAALRRGYEYLAVTDHSKALSVARGLDEKRVLAQKEAIEEVNATLEDGSAGDDKSGHSDPAGECGGAGRGRPFRLLSGIEVDILQSGDLDLADSVLAELDVVVASIHFGLRQDPARLTERLVGAAKNPHVDILGHPTGRLLGEREASSLDLEAVLEEASRTGTAVEINASPERLDLGGAEARLAKEKGCLLAIGTDAHNVRVLDTIAYGVGAARRGWLEAQDVANTRSLDDLLKILRK